MMNWATGKTPTVERERVLSPEMLVHVTVCAVRDFFYGDTKVFIGDLLLMPRHRAEYAAFLGLVALNGAGDG